MLADLPRHVRPGAPLTGAILAAVAALCASCDESAVRMDYQEAQAPAAPATQPAAAPAAAAPATTGVGEKYDSALGLPRAGNRRYVESLHRCVLHREPDAKGVAYHAGRLDAGKNRELIIVNFFELPEYLARRTPDREFIRDAFQAVLGREPAAAETAHYLAELARAPHRRTVILLLFATTEYQQIKAALRGN